MDDGVYIGINLPSRQAGTDAEVVDNAIAAGYDLVTARITSRSYRKALQVSTGARDSATTVSTSSTLPQMAPTVRAPSEGDIMVFPGSHVANTIALSAPWIELDSKDDIVAAVSRQVLAHELAWAQFCGMPYVVLEGPRRRTHVGRYAHALSQLLRAHPQLKIVIHTTFTEEFRAGQLPRDILSTWDVWDAVRVACDYPPNLFVALDVPTPRLPPWVITRWACEPIAMLILSAPEVFVPNARNYPVLPKHLQQLVLDFSQRRPFLLLKDPEMSEYSGGPDACLVYLRHLLSHITPSDYRNAALGDLLQQPLQPLTKPLDSGVYEVFEVDSVKYDLYANAIARALASANLAHVASLVVVVAGAGRGALVDRVLDELANANRAPLVVYAIERHPAAAAYLCHRQATDPTWSQVEIVAEDMRQWCPLHRAHLIVSELLGSFGDNELSPECLDGMQKALDPQGIMIPQSYASWIAPIYSPRIWQRARDQGPEKLEQQWVVSLRQTESIAPPKKVWHYEHPTVSPGSNEREAKVQFVAENRTRVYGFAGYFEAVLWPGIVLSTNPETQDQLSPGLASWFPLYFPLKIPIDVAAGTEIDLCMWRECTPDRIWYEWMTETYRRDGPQRVRLQNSHVHNTTGCHAAYTAL